ncbi:hypothetical protein LEMLEM_LOCUS20983, partial [Lemmus lemmus]
MYLPLRWLVPGLPSPQHCISHFGGWYPGYPHPNTVSPTAVVGTPVTLTPTLYLPLRWFVPGLPSPKSVSPIAVVGTRVTLTPICIS